MVDRKPGRRSNREGDWGVDSDLIYRAAKLLLGSCLVSFVPLDSIPLFAEKRASVSYQRGLLGPNGYEFFLVAAFHFRTFFTAG